MARDTGMLRGVLFEEMEMLRRGEIEPKRAQAVAKLAQQIISTAKVEMDYHRMRRVAREKGEDLLIGSMDLGGRVALVEDQAKAHHSGSVQQEQSPVPSKDGSTFATSAS